ncbi:MAG: GNAT family N-acetyltransferase [Polyangiaceae bacterium]
MPASRITVTWVEPDDVRLGRLMQLYLHEWSAILPHRVRIGSDALFRLDSDLTQLRAALFVDEEALPAGFALIGRDDTGLAHVEEFFVVLGTRRRGVGTAAARALFQAEPRPWTLTVRPENRSALHFWRRAMPGSVEQVEVGEDGVARTRLTLV